MKKPITELDVRKAWQAMKSQTITPYKLSTVLKTFGCSKISSLKPEQYNDAIDAISAITVDTPDTFDFIHRDISVTELLVVLLKSRQRINTLTVTQEYNSKAGVKIEVTYYQ